MESSADKTSPQNDKQATKAVRELFKADTTSILSDHSGKRSRPASLGKGHKACDFCKTVVGSPTRVCPHCHKLLHIKTTHQPAAGL